jgi:hypothetical protein
MKRNILIGLLVVSLLSTIIFGVTAAETTTLRFAAGGMSGDWYIIAAGLMQLVSEKDNTIKLDVVPGAGLENPARVGIKEVDMALSFPPFSKSALDGTAPFTEAYPDIRGGYNGFGSSVGQFLVTKNTGLVTIDDLINQKYPVNLVVEPIGSSDPLFLSRILEFYGVDFATIEKWGGSVKFMGYEDQVVYMKDKHANAAFENTAAPSPPIQQLDFSNLGVRLLKYSDELRKYLKEKYAYSEFVIKKGTYEFMEEDIINCDAKISLIFNKNVPEDVVYRVIKIICENAKRVESISPSLTNIFNPTQASCTDLGVPLHPGAEKYYKEVGWIK